MVGNSFEGVDHMVDQAKVAEVSKKVADLEQLVSCEKNLKSSSLIFPPPPPRLP